jgi:RNA polymerase sigma-70 factor (ECF subfamily)
VPVHPGMRGTSLIRPWRAASAEGHALAASRSEMGILSDPVDLEAQVTRAFETHRGSVYRYLVAGFGRAADAEEVTQEAFLSLYRVLRNGGTVKNVRAWLLRVAHNLALNRIAREQSMSQGDDAFWSKLAERLGDPAPTPEAMAMARQRDHLVRCGLQHLSRQQRQCLLLRVEGLRYREIAEVLGVSVSTVAELLRRGLRKLMRNVHG